MAAEATRTEPSDGRGGAREPDDRYLRVYLSDHLALFDGVASLVERTLSADRWKEHHGILRALGGDLERDRRAIEEIARRRGLTLNPAKRMLARAGERAGRLKGNGRLVQESPLNRLVELEGLRLGVAGCAGFWETVEALALDGAGARGALERLRGHDAELARLHGGIAAAAFRD